MNFVDFFGIITSLSVFDILVQYLLMFVNGNLEATDSTSVKIVSVAAIVFFFSGSSETEQSFMSNKNQKGVISDYQTGFDEHRQVMVMVTLPTSS